MSNGILLVANGLWREPLFSQECHERIRVLSQLSGAAVKQHGLENDLIDRVREDEYFAPIAGEIDQLLDPATFIGRAPEQVRKGGRGGQKCWFPVIV